MIKSFSPTSLKLDRLCPFAWKKRYVNGIRFNAHSTSPAGYGSEIHLLIAKILEQWHKGNKDIYLPSVRFSTGKMIDDWNKNFREYFVETNDYIIEKDLHTTAGGYPIHCLPDYASYDDYNGMAWVFDWKSTRIVLKKEEAENDIQLIMQAYIILRYFKEKDIDICRAGYWLLRYNRYVTPDFDYSIYDLPRLEAAIVAEIEYLVEAEKKGYPATANHECCYCDIRSLCPLKDELNITTPEIPQNEKEATELFKKFKMYSSFTKELENTYKTYIEHTGNSIRYSDVKTVGIKETKKKSADVDIAIDMLGNDEFVDVMSKYLKLDVTKKSKIWRDKEAVKALYDCGIVSETESSTIGIINDIKRKLSADKTIRNKKLIQEIYDEGVEVKDEKRKT